MLSQARSMLEELGAKVSSFIKNVEDDEDKYLENTEYVKMLKVNERARKKAAMVEHLEWESGTMAGEKEIWRKKEDSRAVQKPRPRDQRSE